MLGRLSDGQWRFSKIEGLYLQLFKVRLPEWDLDEILRQLESGNQPARVAVQQVTDVPVRPGNGERRSVLKHVPRKEVIQPHLPVRLPCYDFTPITDPTLDACLPCGLAQRLQVLPTFVV